MTSRSRAVRDSLRSTQRSQSASLAANRLRSIATWIALNKHLRTKGFGGTTTAPFMAWNRHRDVAASGNENDRMVRPIWIAPLQLQGVEVGRRTSSQRQLGTGSRGRAGTLRRRRNFRAANPHGIAIPAIHAPRQSSYQDDEYDGLRCGTDPEECPGAAQRRLLRYISVPRSAPGPMPHRGLL
jgi:hypothetical protein